MDLQIVGVCRFAYPAIGGFQTRHATTAERQAHLWAPERLEARLRTLEHVTLASLAAQEDRDFRVLVVTGDALPGPWLDRLRAAVARVPQARLVLHPPENHRAAMAAVIGAALDPGGPASLQFRLDDDDGVGRRFVARARETARRCAPLWAAHERLAIDFSRGYHYAASPLRVRDLRAPLVSAGLAVILPAGAERTVMHFPHHRLSRQMPTVTIPDAPMWLRGIGGNDSPTGPAIGKLAPPTAEQRGDLRRRFGVDPDALA